VFDCVLYVEEDDRARDVNWSLTHRPRPRPRPACPSVSSLQVFSPFVGLDIKDIRGIGVKPACPAVGNLMQPMPRSPTPTPDPTATGGVNGDGTQADGTGADGRGRGWAAMQPV